MPPYLLDPPTNLWGSGHETIHKAEKPVISNHGYWWQRELQAYKAFRKHSADLLTAIQDPEVLAWELFAESVITSAVVEFSNNMMHDRGERTSKLLMAMGSQIAVDRGAFDVLLSMLAKRPSMSDLCGRTRNTYGKSPRKICRRKGGTVVRCMVMGVGNGGGGFCLPPEFQPTIIKLSEYL